MCTQIRANVSNNGDGCLADYTNMNRPYTRTYIEYSAIRNHSQSENTSNEIDLIGAQM